MGMDRKIEKKKGIRPKHIVIGLISIGVTLLIINAIFGSELSTYKVDREKITISGATYDQFNDYISINGSVKPIATIYLNSAEQGKVEKKFVENGVMVTAGDTILKLANPDLLLAIQNDEATFAKEMSSYYNQLIGINKNKIELMQRRMESDLEVVRMKREYARQKSMFENGLGTREEYIRAKENYEMQLNKNMFLVKSQVQDSISQKNQIEQLNETMKINRLNLNKNRSRADKLYIKTPVSGQLGNFIVEIGQIVSSNQEVGTVDILTDHKISANVDEHYIDRVTTNLMCNIEWQGRDYELVVRRVYPEVKEGQFRIDMYFIGDKPQNIRTGQTYYVKIQLGASKNAVMIPRGGFFQSTGGQWVFALDPAGSYAVKRNIKIGKQNPRYYEVVEGLETGEQVITSSYDTFGDSEKIVFK